MGLKKGVAPNRNFTQIPNDLIRNKEISDGAFRLICWITSHTDGFNVSFKGIQSALGYGRDGLRSIIKNAEQNDYLVRVRGRDTETGKFEWDYYVFTHQQDAIAFRSSLNDDAIDGLPTPGNTTDGSATYGSPTDGSAKGGSEHPHKEYKEEQYQSKKDQTKNIPLSPQGEKEEGGEDEAQAVEAEVVVEQVQSTQSQNLLQPSEQNSNSREPNYSEACYNRELGEEKYKRNQPQYPKNPNGTDRLPWHTRKRMEFDPEFEIHMSKVLARSSYYKNLPAGDLLTQVRKHISKGNYDLEQRDKLQIEWDAMQAKQNAPQMPEMTVDQLVKRVEVQAACRGLQQPQTQQAVSPPPTKSSTEIQKERLRLTKQLRKANSALNAKLSTPYPEMYPPELIANLKAGVEKAQRELATFEAEMEFGF